MNVSSVKNLNGETFSAVQDATLTNVVQTNSGNWQDITAYQNNSGTYLTAVDLSPYQTTADANTLSSMLSGAIDYVSGQVDNKLDTTSFSDVSGSFLTAVDLSNYYTKSETSGASEIADALANIPTGNPEVENYVQTNSGTIDDTVTSYQTNSGEYIKESELEYNAVDEISGIAGSAIAQYGAEKQWLVHDDTIVSISNSAQYAFGCNISALQRLMGIDETVLFSGTPSTSINLAEQFSNFETIKITAHAQEQNTKMAQTFEFPGTNSAFDLHIYSYNSNANSVVNYLTRYNVNGLIFSASTINHWWQLTGSITAGSWQGPGSSPIVPIKVVGVHRISG